MRSKHIFIVCLTLLLSLLWTVPTTAKEAGNIPADFLSLLTKQEKDFLVKTGPIRVHNENDWAPFNFNQNGVPKGFSIDYMKLLAKKTGLQIKFISGPSWDQFLDMVKEDKLDVMLNIAISPERQKFLVFTPSYVTMVQMLYTRKDFPMVSSIKDLYGKRFAVPKGFFLHEVLRAHPQINIVEVSNTSDAIRAVSVGKADALFDLMPVVDYITNQLQITNLKVGGDIGLKEGKPIPLHIAVGNDKKILAGIIEKGMTRITEEELRKLHENWLSGSIRIKQDIAPAKKHELHLTGEEKAFIAGKQLRLGIDIARPPFEYINKKGVYAGISAEFILAAAERLGITVVPQKEMEWTEAMEKIKTGEIDVIPKVTPSPAREMFLNFTSPYTTFPSVIVTRKDRLAGGLDDLRGLKVGVNKGQIVEANLKHEHPELLLVPYSDIEAGLRALATGKCDAYVDNLGAVAYTIETVGLPNLRIAASTPYTHDLAFGIRKDWPLMASALQKALDSMTDQEKTEIRNRWLAIKYQLEIPWHIIVPIGTALLVIIIFVLVWNRRLGRAVREREKSEKKIKAMGEAMADALIMIDSQGRVLFWNKTAEKIFGYTAEEAMGKEFHEIAVPFELREKAHAGIRQFAATGQGVVFGAAVETTAVNRMGDVFPVEVNLSPFKVDNQWFAVGTVRDITERKRVEALKVEKEVAEEAAARAELARQEAEQAQAELKAKVLEIERFNRLSLGREERIIELKRQVNVLAEKANEKPIYHEHELTGVLDDGTIQAESIVLEAEQAAIPLQSLTEILSVDKFKNLLTNFCNSVGIAAAIIDLKGEVLAAARWQKACTDFHRVCEKTLARCIESDTELAIHLNKGKSFSIYRCKNGLIDAASPIIVDGSHIANAFAGQFFTSPPDIEFFRRQAEECGMDVERYLEAISEVPVVAESKLESVLGFLVEVAQIVTAMAIERNHAINAEISIVKQIEESKRERAVAISLAEDANRSRAEIELYKDRLELLVQERTDELRVSEERSRLILGSISEGIFGLDREGRITFVNPAVSAILGYSEEELLGKQVHAAVHYAYPDGSEFPMTKCPVYLSAQDGVARTVDNEVLWHKDGTAIPVEYSTTTVWKNGQISGVVVSFRDITRRKQAEKELKDRMEDLERFSRLTVNREEKMIQLKEEVNAILEQRGEEKKYKIVV